MTGQPLLVFADDWGRHPSSCQHLIRQLLPHHPVTWVNTIGTRKPSFNLATLRRASEKVKQWVRPKPASLTEVSSNPHILNPRMWPSFGSNFSRALNRRLLSRALLPVVGAMEQPPLAITTLPLLADLVGILPVQRWVYYCVDDFSTWPGLDGQTMRTMEQELIQRVDVLIAVSDTLRTHLQSSGKEVHLLTHGVDLDFWTSPANEHPLPALAGLARPLIVFWGLIDRRLDLAFLRHLATSLTEGTVVLAGPENDPDPELNHLPRLVKLGTQPFEVLPALARQSAVLIMPYADLPVTRAMQPLKLKEYLATGRPVVVRDLPATRPWSAALDLAATPEEFSAAVKKRTVSSVPAEHQTTRLSLTDESWSAKARQLLQMVGN